MNDSLLLITSRYINLLTRSARTFVLQLGATCQRWHGPCFKYVRAPAAGATLPGRRHGGARLKGSGGVWRRGARAALAAGVSHFTGILTLAPRFLAQATMRAEREKQLADELGETGFPDDRDDAGRDESAAPAGAVGDTHEAAQLELRVLEAQAAALQVRGVASCAHIVLFVCTAKFRGGSARRGARRCRTDFLDFPEFRLTPDGGILQDELQQERKSLLREKLACFEQLAASTAEGQAAGAGAIVRRHQRGGAAQPGSTAAALPGHGHGTTAATGVGAEALDGFGWPDEPVYVTAHEFDNRTLY